MAHSAAVCARVYLLIHQYYDCTYEFYVLANSPGRGTDGRTIGHTGDTQYSGEGSKGGIHKRTNFARYRINKSLVQRTSVAGREGYSLSTPLQSSLAPAETASSAYGGMPKLL